MRRGAAAKPLVMRVLFASDFCPWPLTSGYALRIYYILQALSQRHEVTLATITPDDIELGDFPPSQFCALVVPLSASTLAFNRTDKFDRWAPAHRRLMTIAESPLPNNVRRWRSATIERTLAALNRTDAFDVVWAEKPFIAELARRAGFRRIAVDLPDLDSISLQRMLGAAPSYASKPLHALEFAKVYAYEQSLPLRFSKVIVCREEERQFFRFRQSRISIVPNGVSELPPAAEESAADAPELLFVGSLDYEPNVDCVSRFAQAIFPLVRQRYPAATFSIVGRGPVPRVLDLARLPGCRVVSNPVDLSPYFDRATLFVVPMRLGSGTRLKVLEAVARQKAVVATQIAAEGLQLRPGVDLEVADADDDFAAACCRLIADPASRRRMAEAGRARVLEFYRWSAITPLAEDALYEAAGTPIPRTDADGAAQRL